MPRHRYLIQPILERIIQRAPYAGDYLYAIATGTAIGMFANPEVRKVYEYYRASARDFDDKVIKKRFKGDVVVDEGSSTQLETLRPTDEKYGRYGGGGKYRHRFVGGYTKRRRSRRNPRRKHIKGCVCRNVATRFIKRRKFRRYFA